MKITNIRETAETYAKLYFIYVIQSSLIISNYSIRTDSDIRFYVRQKHDKENKGAFGERLKGWSFSEKDKKKVRTIIDSHDKKKK